MEKMIAFCGLTCTECDAYVATQANDKEALAAVAAKWSQQFDPNITPENILCDGCLATTDRLCGYCSECPMRLCGLERGVVNCAHCADYEGCEKLAEFFSHAPNMREVLDGLRAQIAAD